MRLLTRGCAVPYGLTATAFLEGLLDVILLLGTTRANTRYAAHSRRSGWVPCDGLEAEMKVTGAGAQVSSTDAECIKNSNVYTAALYTLATVQSVPHRPQAPPISHLSLINSATGHKSATIIHAMRIQLRSYGVARIGVTITLSRIEKRTARNFVSGEISLLQ